MSTFKGILEEFPDIRIDYFRTNPVKKPPLACFLSHVHSDHLLGLESLKSPFIYCSPPTRQILLRLEKYPHRMNFLKGILECQIKSYKHLGKLLRTIPLDTPMRIELSPGNDIQVTLFDANHCTGAVMFLIQNQRNAILYTGDIRAEPWWVNSLLRNPVMLPFTSGCSPLDRVYLDTTFAAKDEPYRNFPTKAEGLQELLSKIKEFPRDTEFYFNSWTFGYEDVYVVLSQALESKVHLDEYRWGIYSSLAGIDCREKAVLCGFRCGNNIENGCLATDQSVRLHSCERGAGCRIFENHMKDVVIITPIISRHNGTEMRELGAGGGHGDLNQIHQLNVQDRSEVEQLVNLCTSRIKHQSTAVQTTEMLLSALEKHQQFIPLYSSNQTTIESSMPLTQLVELLKEVSVKQRDPERQPGITAETQNLSLQKARSINFPYSRHSSYAELRHLIGTLRPRDIFPCTVPPLEHWEENMSMETLFGDLLFDPIKESAFDSDMRAAVREIKSAGLGRADIEVDDRESADSQRPKGDDDSTASDLSSEISLEITCQAPAASIKRKRDEDVKLAANYKIRRRIEACEAVRGSRWGEDGNELDVVAERCRTASEEL